MLKSIAKVLIGLVVLNIVLAPFMLLAPAGFVVLPLIAAHSHDDLSGLAQLWFWLAPLSCAFWMLVSCHWQTVRRAQREGRLETWRDAEGGILRTVTKATLYMFAGLFGSYFFELVLLLMFVLLRLPGSVTFRFALLPLATFAPVIFLWLFRWQRGRKHEDFISRMRNDRALQAQLRAASLYARTLREKDAKARWREGE